MAPKRKSKIRTKEIHDSQKQKVKGESSKGTKRPRVSKDQTTFTKMGIPISPPFKKQRSFVPNEEAERFINDKAEKLFIQLQYVHFSDSKVFDFSFEDALRKFELRDFYVEFVDYCPELVIKFQANARQWINENEKDSFYYQTIGVQSRVNGVEIIIDEKMLTKLFNLPLVGIKVK